MQKISFSVVEEGELSSKQPLPGLRLFLVNLLSRQDHMLPRREIQEMISTA